MTDHDTRHTPEATDRETDDRQRHQAPHQEVAHDPGAYVGREPERLAETIPGGIGPKDERVSAVATQPSGGEGPDVPPSGHRQGDRASDDDVRRAGDDG